jgi:hypothetical protein
MENKVNMKSMFLGATLGAVVLLCGAAVNSQSHPNGRYQLVVTDSYVFKIDTTTGQVWKSLVKSTQTKFMEANPR